MKTLIPEIDSLFDLQDKAKTDPRYAKLATVAASNMGIDAYDSQGKDHVQASIEYLAMIINDVGDFEGVIDEINFCRDMI